MSSEKSPFKDKSCLTPRPLKTHEPRKKLNRIILTTKDCHKCRNKRRKAPRFDPSRPRWHIYFGARYYYTSRKMGISQALQEFTVKYPERRIWKIVPSTTVYR